MNYKNNCGQFGCCNYNKPNNYNHCKDCQYYNDKIEEKAIYIHKDGVKYVVVDMHKDTYVEDLVFYAPIPYRIGDRLFVRSASHFLESFSLELFFKL